MRIDSGGGPDTPDKDANQSTIEQGSTAQGGTGTGFIQVGDLRYDLKVSRCTTILGMISGEAESVTEPENVTVNFEAIPNDWSDSKSIDMVGHTGYVALSIENPWKRWKTGQLASEGLNLPPGVSTADLVVTDRDLSADGQDFTGKATFLETNLRSPSTAPRVAEDDTPAESGSFSFSCPPAD